MKISLFFEPYETLTEKEQRLAYKEDQEIQEEKEEKGEGEREDMKLEEEGEEEGETSLESIDFPPRSTNKDIINNQKKTVENQKILKCSVSKKLTTISNKMDKLFGKMKHKLG